MKNIKLSYFLRRTLSALFTLWIALTINFFLPRLMGGDPADFMASQTALGSQEYADGSDQNTDDIGADPDEPELPLCPVGDDDRDRVVGGYTEVRSHVERCCKADDQDADHKEDASDRERRLGAEV